MELIIAMVLFALIVATWLFLPGSLVEPHPSDVVAAGPVRRAV